MPAAWIAAGGALLGAMNAGEGGGGQQTVSKDPWAPAQPWLTSLLGQGQNLQGYYQQNPFNGIQQGSYANLLQGNDYINGMVPGLLAQMNQPVGFDRNNPRGRPPMMQMPAMTRPMSPLTGLLTNEPGSGNATGINAAQSPFRNGLMPPMAAAAPAAPANPFLNYATPVYGNNGDAS